ncbi:hypothetical protein Ct61P_08476 [Colletotrichum tofieldiae]|nr:hypothetical protein Ct61P_08476 [Colletotrichum tofieldiae]
MAKEQAVSLERPGTGLGPANLPDPAATDTFVVDNNWITDHTAPQEPDHEGNVNNFLTPDQIAKEDTSAAIMNTVTPESTTAALAKDVPLEKKEELPQATPSDIPGGFPVTPAANELDKTLGVNPLPAQDVTAEPVTVAPGEPIPPSAKTGDINDQVKLDKEAYEDSSALPGLSKEETTLPAVTSNTIPESSLPIATTDVTINSAAPTSTTAALAAEVPIETKTAEVPEVVKESQEKAHAEPEASANPEAVQEKAVVEDELLEKVPTVVKESIAESGKSPEAAANTEAVIEKKEVEAELLKEVKTEAEKAKIEAEKPKVEAAKEEVKETKEEVKEGDKTKTQAVKEEAKHAKEEVKDAVTKDDSKKEANGANGAHTTPITTAPANGTNGATPAATKEPAVPTTPAKAPSSVPESTTPSHSKAAESPSGTEKKKKNRLSAFIGKIKSKVHSK